MDPGIQTQGDYRCLTGPAWLTGAEKGPREPTGQVSQHVLGWNESPWINPGQPGLSSPS